MAGRKSRTSKSSRRRSSRHFNEGRRVCIRSEQFSFHYLSQPVWARKQLPVPVPSFEFIWCSIDRLSLCKVQFGGVFSPYPTEPPSTCSWNLPSIYIDGGNLWGRTIGFRPSISNTPAYQERTLAA